MTTRKDSNKNQIVTNINYDQNSLSIFWKPLITKSKWHQLKFILKGFTGNFLEQNMGLFLNATWQQVDCKWAKGARLIKTLLFLKKQKLNWNWLETLRIKWNHWESLLCLIRERLRPFIIQDMSYDYKKNDKYRQKTKKMHDKLCTKTMSPIMQILGWSPKTIKIFVCIFASENICKSCDAHFCDTLKRKQKPTKVGKYTKITKIGFMKTGCSKNKDHLRKKKPLLRANCVLIDKWRDLYIEMFSYNLTQNKIRRSQKSISFFLKTNIFKIHSQ